jgi:ADP-ribose diphosphatase
LTDGPTFRTIASRDLATASFLTVQMRTIATPSGREVERVVIVHPGAVAIVPIIDDDVILIEQYRASAESTVLEIPAGKIDDPSHDRLETAHRELEEETGYRAGRMRRLTDLLTAVGFSDERITIFLAEDLTPGARAPMGAEEEEAHIVRMPLSEAVRRVRDGSIADAKTVAGLLLAAPPRDPA